MAKNKVEEDPSFWKGLTRADLEHIGRVAKGEFSNDEYARHFYDCLIQECGPFCPATPDEIREELPQHTYLLDIDDIIQQCFMSLIILKYKPRRLKSLKKFIYSFIARWYAKNHIFMNISKSPRLTIYYSIPVDETYELQPRIFDIDFLLDKDNRLLPFHRYILYCFEQGYYRLSFQRLTREDKKILYLHMKRLKEDKVLDLFAFINHKTIIGRKGVRKWTTRSLKTNKR